MIRVGEGSTEWSPQKGESRPMQSETDFTASLAGREHVFQGSRFPEATAMLYGGRPRQTLLRLVTPVADPIAKEWSKLPGPVSARPGRGSDQEDTRAASVGGGMRWLRRMGWMLPTAFKAASPHETAAFVSKI